MPPILGYWDIRGLAQGIRLLLKHVGADFEDKLYSCGPAPDFSRDDWLSKKFTLGLDFPNLPYYMDGDIKLTQTRAIYRYLARKHGLEGASEEEKIRIDVLVEQAADISSGFTRLCYNPNFDNLVDDYKKELPTKLGQLEKFLGENKWFAGEKLTWADFPVYEIIDHHVILDPKCLDDFPQLKAHHDRFEDLANIKAYMQSDNFIKRPLNNKMAKFK